MKGHAKSTTLSGILLTVAILGLGVGGCMAYRSTERTVTATVEGKERVCDTTQSDGQTRVDCYYLVFTDEGTFKLADSLAFGRFNSSDIYGRIKEGRTYEFAVAGWRLPIFSQYPNIVSDPEEVKS